MVRCLMMAPEHLYYFGGYDSSVSVNSPQAFIFTAGDDQSTLLLRAADLPLAEESSWVSEILADKGVTAGRVAIKLSSYAVPALLGDALSKFRQFDSDQDQIASEDTLAIWEKSLSVVNILISRSIHREASKASIVPA